MIKNFTELEVWKVADDLFDMIVADSLNFPKTIPAKIITDQIIRSIGSISANIAEGIGRGGNKELIRHLIIARGSLVESQNWLLKIKKLGWITEERFKVYMQKLAHDRVMINFFIGKLRKS